jgi:predicted transcriptional regulator of viral defense system
VAELTGLDHQYCKKTVGNLIKQGLIRRTKYGHYSTNDPYADL